MARIKEIKTGMPAYITIEASNYRRVQVYALVNHLTGEVWLPDPLDRKMIEDHDAFTTEVLGMLKTQTAKTAPSLPENVLHSAQKALDLSRQQMEEHARKE